MVNRLSEQMDPQCVRLQKEIEVKNSALVQKMIDLEALMNQVEQYKKDTESNVISNIETTILPILRKIKIQPESAEYMDLLENNLKNIVSEFGIKIASRLSSREREVVSFIKKGLTNKEISEVLNLSPRTIDNHRQKIREKLNLSKSKISLKNWLYENT